MQKGQQVRATRSIKSGQIVIAKGAVGKVTGKRGFFSTKYNVRFATAGANAVIRDVSERDLVPNVLPKFGDGKRR